MGRKTLADIYGLPNAVNNNGAVSPAIRATESITPDNIPLKPQGTIIRKLLCDKAALMQILLPLKLQGISFRVSSVERIIIGKHHDCKATLPEMAEKVPLGFTIQK